MIAQFHKKCLCFTGSDFCPPLYTAPDGEGIVSLSPNLQFRVDTAVGFARAAITAVQTLDDPNHPVEILHSDFFELSGNFNGRYQYILDYTSFCAVQLPHRGEYADLVARLLQPGGQFVTLAFPIGKWPGGPPLHRAA
ncbi:MAG TPA: hypothetical protein PLK31_14935 [Chloroflexota bacterium]|nr:hypothetical protein [Chloroflexota bacterium]